MQLAGGRVALSHFERAYSQYFGVNLAPASYGYPSLVALVQAVPLVLSIRGKTYHRKVVMLTPRFQGNCDKNYQNFCDKMVRFISNFTSSVLNCVIARV